MNIREMLDEGLRELEGILGPDEATPHRVKYRGRDVPCTISSERRGEELAVGGILRTVQLTVIIRASVLKPIRDSSSNEGTVDNDELTLDLDQIEPRSHKRIQLTSRNRTYLIAQTRLDGSGAYYALDLVDPYRP